MNHITEHPNSCGSLHGSPSTSYAGERLTASVGTLAVLGLTFLAMVSTVRGQDKTPTQIEYWKGTLDYKGVKLEMGLKVFRDPDGSLSAKFDSYTQGAVDIPTKFNRKGDSYQLEIPAARLQYAGTLDKTKAKLLGRITQGGSDIELNFDRTEFDGAPKYNRPQTPKEPFPYRAEEVSYKNSVQGHKLAGTLTIPLGKGPFPVAITISGSGAADRNESHFGHKPFLVVADHLTRQGIAVLRYDDRGVAGSTGDYSKATSADLATDVEAAIEFLKKHPKINARRIGLIGHSEGGLIAPMVAAKRTDVHFIVLLAGPGVNGGAILKSQSTAMMKAEGKSDKELQENQQVHDAVLSTITTNPKATPQEITDASRKFLNSIGDAESRKRMQSGVKELQRLLKSRWVNYFVRHEPTEVLPKVKCHVLAMNGEKDLQVVCDLNLPPIEKALRAGSPASMQVVRLPNLNHMFQETNGSGSPSDYGTIEETFSPKALTVVSQWLAKVNR